MTLDTEPLSLLTSWGVIRLDIAEAGVVRCSLPRLNDIPRDPFAILQAGVDPYSCFVRELFEGGNPDRPSIGELHGTVFQKKVWDGMLKIPHGETLSYGKLAERIGRASACRAVANACGSNPLPLFIPCHRVIRSDGNLGGYSSGIAWKRLLLGAEQLNRM